MNPAEGAARPSPLIADEDGSRDIAEDVADDSALGEPHERSLREDVEALIDDGKTYLEAELNFQKTRAAFVAERAKGAFIFGAIAALFGFLALIGLTVGLIIALTPMLTAWGASALVVALLLVAAFLAVKAASRRWNRPMAAIEDRPGPTP